MSEAVLGDAHAFVVRIWCESADEAGNTLTYRGVIQDVTTGRQMGFENVQTLAAFICQEAKLSALDGEDELRVCAMPLERSNTMTPTPIAAFKSGINIEKLVLPAGQHVELFGHVTLVEGYSVPVYVGCHALVALRDTPGITVAVMTTATHLQSLLETGLATGNLIAFRGQKLTNPPTPLGGTWSVDVYSIYGLILYGMN